MKGDNPSPKCIKGDN